MLEDEFDKFVSDCEPLDPKSILPIKNYFKAYATNGWTRYIIDRREFTRLATSPVFSTQDYRAVPRKYREIVPEYIKDYVSLNQFAA